MSNPAIAARPALGAMNPVSIRISVVFPAPFGPRNATTCPWRIENDASWTATNGPKYLLRPWASIIVTGVDGAGWPS